MGALDKVTMREFDDACLDPVIQINHGDIRRLRESNNLSQPVFARYLNTSRSTVEKWETGAKRPSGLALKLLAVIRKHGLEVLH